ncbi:hypothetical protein POTOM_024129 [Populus tomentosa]|uniref:Uncharacterized protein n=1 Tax=Populus tomentosa TaxID=118781 RepID=A0A8X7ZPF5_POPTO|nr:hypothetical protein POTOM_024129 [Populus tomentosa]
MKRKLDRLSFVVYSPWGFSCEGLVLFLLMNKVNICNLLHVFEVLLFRPGVFLDSERGFLSFVRKSQLFDLNSYVIVLLINVLLIADPSFLNDLLKNLMPWNIFLTFVFSLLNGFNTGKIGKKTMQRSMLIAHREMMPHSRQRRWQCWPAARSGVQIPRTVTSDHKGSPATLRKGRMVLRDDDFPMDYSWQATRSMSLSRSCKFGDTNGKESISGTRSSTETAFLGKDNRENFPSSSSTSFPVHRKMFRQNPG